MEWHQLNISVPEPLYRELARLVPAGERTRFLTRLTEDGLRQLRLKQALKTTFGAWAKTRHPELKAGAGRFVRFMRRPRR